MRICFMSFSYFSLISGQTGRPASISGAETPGAEKARVRRRSGISFSVIFFRRLKLEKGAGEGTDSQFELARRD